MGIHDEAAPAQVVGVTNASARTLIVNDSLLQPNVSVRLLIKLVNC